MNYDNAILEKVRAFGVLGTPIEEMVYLVEPDDPEQFELDMQNPDSEIYNAYQKGMATGKYTMGKALFDQSKNNNLDANDKLFQRQQTQRINSAIHDKFKL
jgi:hypothetical protein